MFVAEVGRGQHHDVAAAAVATDFRRHADAIDGRVDDLAGDWAVAAEVSAGTLRSIAAAVDDEPGVVGPGEVAGVPLDQDGDTQPPPESGLLYLNLACHLEQVPPFD